MIYWPGGGGNQICNLSPQNRWKVASQWTATFDIILFLAKLALKWYHACQNYHILRLDYVCQGLLIYFIFICIKVPISISVPENTTLCQFCGAISHTFVGWGRSCVSTATSNYKWCSAVPSLLTWSLSKTIMCFNQQLLNICQKSISFIFCNEMSSHPS